MTFRGILLTDFANISLIFEQNRMIDEIKSFVEIWEDCASKLGLVDCSKPSVTDSDQGCVAGMPLVKGRLKRMKKVLVFYELC